MCMLTFVPANKMPDNNALYNGACQNPDGHGAAVVTHEGTIEVFRSLDEVEVVEWFSDMKAKNLGLPGLFHSRIGTSGLINKGTANLHPFEIGGPDTVLGHNGILPQATWPEKDDPRSDTAIMCEDFLANDVFGPLSTRSTRRRVGQWIGPGNKFVILTVNPAFRKNAYIINADSGIWDGGIWYSNYDYAWGKGRRSSQFSGGDYRSWEEYLEDTARVAVKQNECLWCDALDYRNTLANYGYCSWCKACEECGSDIASCMCYDPARPKVHQQPAADAAMPPWQLS